MSYDDLRLTASHEPFLENPRLTRFIYTLLKIRCKLFFRSLHNLINRFLRELKPRRYIMCNLQKNCIVQNLNPKPRCKSF